MDYSFIIPAHDEQDYLPATIAAIRAGMAPLSASYEVIVVADGCTDATATIAAACGARVEQHARRQIAATRNLGARAATGDWLVFVDADTRVTPPALAEMTDIRKSGAIGGGGPIQLDGPLPLYARLLLPVLSTIFRWANLTGGAFIFCSRAAFETVRGFDETYYASEEVHFARALKRLGRFRLTRAPVMTSGRKLRTHSSRELFGLLWRGVLRPKSLKERASLGFFYGPRRTDPHHRAP